MLSEVRVDSPVSRFVRIRKRRSFYRRSKSCMVELPPMGGEADFDVAKTFATSQLSKCHRQKLLPTGKAPDAPIPVIAMNKSIKLVVGNQLKQLSENGLPAVHRRSPRGMIRLYLRKKAIFFKSFETVFARYFLTILDFPGFRKSLTGHYWVRPQISPVLRKNPFVQNAPGKPRAPRLGSRVDAGLRLTSHFREAPTTARITPSVLL